jgi:plastocyanin
VTIRNLRYEPDTLRVQVGDTVRWVNEDIVPHTVTTRSKGWDSGTFGQAQSWQVVPATAGSSEYYCELHPMMRGVIVAR